MHAHLIVGHLDDVHMAECRVGISTVLKLLALKGTVSGKMVFLVARITPYDIFLHDLTILCAWS